MRFDGDIIITDPCYIIKEQKEEGKPDWVAIHGRDRYTSEFLSTSEGKKVLLENTKAYDEALSKWEELNPDDWSRCDYGDNMGILGFSENHLVSPTGYGDWSCTAYEGPKGEFKDPKVLGEFCADAGMVAVFLLSEVLKYNPDFDWHVTRPWTTTCIKDFHGEVDIVDDGEEGVEVIGTGNINFFATQTGL